jgi:CHAT domain-containing protein
MSETNVTNSDIAIERVVGFAQKFNRAHLDLACHAAFPQTLTPDLLYQIWLRFVPQAPWTAVARIILSRLCREVGYELYEMDIDVRNLLLTELKEDKRFGEQRLNELAEFYNNYLKQQFGSEEREEEDLTQPQYWIALASTSSKQKLSQKIAKAIELRLKQENWKELFRLASSIEAVPQALVKFEAPLINYARGMLNFTTGDLEGAAEEFSKLQRRERQVDIAGVNLSIPDEVPLVKVKLAFLQRLLQIISENSGDPQAVYPFLAENVEKLNEDLAEVLRLWATKILAQVQPDEARLLATIIINFSILISQFPLGSRASNIEIAITGYQIVLSVFTREAFPVDWARTQNNLGTAYRDRIMGDKVENLERAIAAFQAALSVSLRSSFPVDWARTQNNLGTAYFNKIQGDKANNIERAITSYQNALSVITRNDFPKDWAFTQNNLGRAYSDRIKGDKAENIEQAIASYQNALSVTTRNDFPQDWAQTQINLGTAYRERIKGDKAENIEQAIAFLQQALQVITFQAFPYDWADTQINLGTAYHDRIKGDKADNIEQAIIAYQQALQVTTRQAFPYEWADTQINLGTAYHDRIKGDKADNIEQAIIVYQQALEVTTRQAFPQDNAETLFKLGLIYQNAQRFNEAYTTFEQTIETVESLRSEIISGDETKRKQAEKWNKVYSCMVKVCLELKEYTQAIEYIERSKTRNLVELILERDRKTIFPPEVVVQSEKLQDEITTVQYQIQNGKAEDPQVLAQHLQQLRQQQNELQNQYLPIGSGFKFESFQAIFDKRTAIIEWYILDDEILAFIIKSVGEITVWQSQPEDLKAFIDWENQYLADYHNQKDKWQNQLEEHLQKLAEILHIEEILAQIPKDFNRLILIPHRFLHLLPLHALPIWESYLIDLFPNGISYAPSCQLLQLVQTRQRPKFSNFFAIQNPNQDLYWSDMEVTSIANNFPHVNVLMGKTAIKENITNELLQSAHCIHFSGHSYFNFHSPLKSALILANANISETIDQSECLTIAEIFNLNLSECRLVTLPTTETAVTNFTSVSDEYIGFPSAFIVAGATSVVGSFWSPSDLSTALLMIKFYHNLYIGNTIAVALNQAQIWLREVTKLQLQEWILTMKMNPTLKVSLRRGFHRLSDDAKPFREPFYWAAFSVIGA